MCSLKFVRYEFGMSSHSSEKYHLFLIPINVYTPPRINNKTPATERPGVITGWTGSAFGFGFAVPICKSVLLQPDKG